MGQKYRAQILLEPEQHKALWAGRLGQIVAYDAVYLALAEELSAEF
jgi:predicted nucleic acid-binding protein